MKLLVMLPPPFSYHLSLRSNIFTSLLVLKRDQISQQTALFFKVEVDNVAPLKVSAVRISKITGNNLSDYHAISHKTRQLSTIMKTSHVQ